MSLFLFLIMSQIFIAILLGAYDAASCRDANRTRDLLLPPHFVSINGALRSGTSRFNLRFPVYLLTWYDIECQTWGPLLLYALVLHVAEADSDKNPAGEAWAALLRGKSNHEENDKSVQLMTDPEELLDALLEAELSEAAARQSVVRICSMYGAKVNVAANAKAETPKRTAARTTAALNSLGGNDMVLLKMVQAQQRSEVLLASVAQKMLELQSQFAADHASVVNSISSGNIQLESGIDEIMRRSMSTTTQQVAPMFTTPTVDGKSAGFGQNIGKGIDNLGGTLGKGIKDTTVPIGKALGIDKLGNSITSIIKGKVGGLYNGRVV